MTLSFGDRTACAVLSTLGAGCHGGHGSGITERGALYCAERKGRAKMQQELFNGRYFEQKVRWKDLNAQISCEGLPEEELERLEEEGPKYQYGEGCLSDGVLGAWLAELAGLPEIIDRNMIESHLLSVFRYNFKDDLSGHANPQRPGYALGKEGGLLLCTWPKGGKPSLPFVYSDEVWTGIEYQVATHLMMHGYLDEAVQIIRTTRSRYDGIRSATLTTNTSAATGTPAPWHPMPVSRHSLGHGMTPHRKRFTCTRNARK
ncbi:MAG: GH116 family glycosyl hydrolase [Hydrogeniiclostridium mannosilyticum]